MSGVTETCQLRCVPSRLQAVVAWGVLLVGLAAPRPLAAGDGSAAVDFQRDVRPILASHCYRCHSGSEPQAELDLTRRESALGSVDAREPAVVPHDAAASPLWQRVSAQDSSDRMPPEGPPLTAAQQQILRRWIETGAAWPAHWAYQPLNAPSVPAFASAELAAWGRNPIDNFIAARLAAAGLTPSPAAEGRVLARRVYFDLWGLPPSPAELDAFLADEAPGAYERLVDRLLASPRYGERWARHWMDIVHFAETHGHDQDRPRDHAWPYRDYLVRAFNSDKPYARFVQEQVAGDALFPDDPWATVATGFLAAGPWDESSLRDIREDSLDREIARYLDRDDIVTTVMSTFVSSTAQCARCHDHKFDPIAQRDYYALQAVFAGTDKANRPYDADPQVAAARQKLTTLRAAVAGRVQAEDPTLLAAELQSQVAAWEQGEAALAAAWLTLQGIEASSLAGTTLTPHSDGSLLASGTRPDKDVYVVTGILPAASLRGLRLEVLTDDSLPMHGPGRQDNGNLHLNELRAFVVSDDAGHESWRPVTLKSPRADFNQDGWTIEHAVDGNPNTAWGIHPQVSQNHEAIFATEHISTQASSLRLRVELHQIHGAGHLIGKLRLSATSNAAAVQAASRQLPEEILAIVRTPAAARTDQQRRVLTGYYLETSYEREIAELPPPAKVYCGTNQFTADGSFRPAAQPREIMVLARGNISTPLEPAQPGALRCLPALDGDFALASAAEEPQRRAALAAWLADRRNVLTWRSIANRVWHYHFGRGVVDTPSDFGQLGSPPTHPELLDWLAVRLRDGHGSLKLLHREIVTSSTYRQASTHRPEAAAVDGDNRLLWRMNRRRLEAESFRDALLGVSDSLDYQMGGPSARQFNVTATVHVTPDLDYLGFDVTDPANYRRSVYRFIFRTVPDPFMDALDCPDASQLTPQRTESVTPLQSLATLNDKLVIRASELLAAKIHARAATPDEQVRLAFRWILAREAGAEEARRVAAYATRHGLANACRFLFNTNEFLFVD